MELEKRVLMRMIGIVFRRSMTRIKRIMERYGLSAAEQPLFMEINLHPGSTQEELTRLVGVDKAATTRTLRSLEAKGLVARRQDASDRRQNRIHPTAAARALFPDILDALFAFNERVTADLTDAQVQGALQTLQVIKANLDALREEEDDGSESVRREKPREERW